MTASGPWRATTAFFSEPIWIGPLDGRHAVDDRPSTLGHELVLDGKVPIDDFELVVGRLGPPPRRQWRLTGVQSFSRLRRRGAPMPTGQQEHPRGLPAPPAQNAGLAEADRLYRIMLKVGASTQSRRCCDGCGDRRTCPFFETGLDDCQHCLLCRSSAEARKR